MYRTVVGGNTLPAALEGAGRAGTAPSLWTDDQWRDFCAANGYEAPCSDSEKPCYV